MGRGKEVREAGGERGEGRGGREEGRGERGGGDGDGMHAEAPVIDEYKCMPCHANLYFF